MLTKSPLPDSVEITELLCIMCGAVLEACSTLEEKVRKKVSLSHDKPLLPQPPFSDLLRFCWHKTKERRGSWCMLVSLGSTSSLPSRSPAHPCLVAHPSSHIPAMFHCQLISSGGWSTLCWLTYPSTRHRNWWPYHECWQHIIYAARLALLLVECTVTLGPKVSSVGKQH